jgi:ribosomal protein S18 acetylase RimI-like enzyme
MSVRGLMLPWEENYVEIGERLLNESMEQVKTRTIKKLEFRCDTGHPYHKEMMAVCEKAGYRLFQEKYRYQLEEFDEDDDYRNQFVFKTLQEVGEERFINAIQRITVQTLDRVDENDCELLGAEEAARAYFHILKSVDYTPHRWVLAYNTDKKLIGLVVAQLLSQNTGCINSIGVIPEYRGKNYSRDLVIKAHSLLRNVKSVTEIVAEIDTENVPLENTLASLQYKKTKTMWIYHGDL